MSADRFSLRQYLRLVRLPNLPSAISEIIAGYCISTAVFKNVFSWNELLLLIGASSALYLAGMAFNDIADRAEDSRVRPNRPIPSGAVSLRGAVLCAAGLMLAGIGLAACVSLPSSCCALALSVAILSYDFICKGKFLPGPLALGACRGLNMLLACSAAPEVVEALKNSHAWNLPWLAAWASAFYGAGITAFSGQEESGRSPGALVLGWILLAAAFATAAAIPLVIQIPHHYGWTVLAYIFLLLIVRSLAALTAELRMIRTPGNARALVLTGLQSYPWLDAAMLLPVLGAAALNPVCVILILPFAGKFLRGWLEQREA